ncbi:Uncharacterized protein involved in exopolysaccharide biosynthesis [Paracoccus solventivorans]|uniref:Uncharacterized protein involved in exopolysaccharide biosynthesis n=1 Tax=Paracoccus solventivorans TaxID=53463 RepID=A0A1M7JJZ4_9RHOB|nr:hypothetical protein [Paracoccus solventivorans]SHM53221.1 Uncharacterized protein involved in exopolysaccharide biosynthesis [Paracoccus solventivorans]
MLHIVQTPAEAVSALWRHRWLAGGVLVAGSAISLQVALMQPRSFESSALIQIDNLQSVNPEGDARTSLASSAWLEQIEARLMRRDHLLQILDDYGLFSDLPATDSEKVALLRQTLRIVPVSQRAPVYGVEPAMGLLQVTAQADSAELAATLANDLAAQLVALNAEIVEQRVQETAAFYIHEETRLEQQIADVDARISDYRRRNFDVLPTGLHNRTEELLQLGVSIREIDAELVGLRRKQAATDDRGSALERQAAEELQRQISVLETQREALQARVAEIEDTARQSVTAEAELAALDRERDTLREQLVGVANRRVAAESQQRRDSSMVSDSFTLLEKAVPPDYPMSSQRKKIALGGGMLSVLAALALTLLMEMRRPVIRTAAQMERITGLRPVIDLPDTKQKNPRR